MEIVSCQVYSGGDVRETRPLLNVRLSMRANTLIPNLLPRIDWHGNKPFIFNIVPVLGAWVKNDVQKFDSTLRGAIK